MLLKKTQARSSVLTVAAIAIISIVIKLTLFIIFYHGNSTQIFQPDSGTYIIPAHWLLSTGHYLSSPTTYMFIRTPGYPTFIAAIFYLFGHNYSALIISQIILTIIPIFCVFLMGRKLFNNYIGICASIFVALDYLIFGYTYLVLTDFLYLVILSVIFLLGVLVLSSDRPLYKHVFFTGLFLAIATLIRPVNYFLIFPIALGFIIFSIGKRFSYKQIAILLLLLFSANFILVGGWQIRNKITVGSFRISGIASLSGANLKLLFPENYQLYAKKDTLGDNHNKKQIINSKQGIEILAQHPMLTAKQMLFGMIKTTMGTGRAMIQFFGNYQNILTFRKVKQDLIHFNFTKALHSYQNYTFNWFTSTYIFGALCVNVLLYILICVAFFLMHRNRLFKPALFSHVFLLGIVLYFLAFSSNAASNARFRLPFQLIIDFYAAVGFMLLLGKFKKKKSINSESSI